MTSSAQNSKQVLAQQGSAAVPSYSFLGDQDTGAYRSGANEWSIATNGTQRVVVNANGNVGIGTASPASKLVVSDGTVSVDTSPYAAGSSAYFGCSTNHALALITNNSERMRVTSAGDVGIGTSTPSTALDVNGVVTATNAYGGFAALQSAGGTGYRWTLSNDGTFRLQSTTNGFSSATTPIHVSSTGNVGIGTSSPSYKLDVAGIVRLGDAGAATFLVNFGTSGVGTDRSAYLYGDGTNVFFNNQQNGALRFGTNNTERMRIDSAGNVGIGTSTPTTKLDIVAGADTWATTFFGLSTSNTVRIGTYSGAAAIGANNNAGSAWADLLLNPAGNVYICTDAGNVGIGTSSASVKLTTKGRFSAYDSSLGADDTGYNGTLCSTRPAASGQHINLTRFGYFVWSVGTVYNTNTFGIGVGQATDSNFSTPVFQISENNKVSIGAAPSNIVKLMVTGASAGNSNYTFYAQNSNGSATLFSRDDGNVGMPQIPGSFTTGSGANVYMDGSGEIYLSTSSLRYKRAVVDYTRGLADAMKLRPVFYKGKSERDGDTQFAGLIAEEVHAAGLTEFVVYDENGKPNALHYGNMVALCIKTIQELKLEIDKLKGISK